MIPRACLTCKHFTLEAPGGYCDTCETPGSIGCAVYSPAFSDVDLGAPALITIAENCNLYQVHESLTKADAPGDGEVR